MANPYGLNVRLVLLLFSGFARVRWFKLTERNKVEGLKIMCRSSKEKDMIIKKVTVCEFG